MKSKGSWKLMDETQVSNRRLVEDVFQKSLTILLEKAAFTAEFNGWKELERNERENRENTKRKLRALHILVDGRALTTSAHIRGALHRLLLEMEGLIFDNPPEAWDGLNEKIGNQEIVDLFAHYQVSRKNHIQSGNAIARAYLLNEAEYANELGLSDIREPDEEFDELSFEEYKERSNYGYQGNLRLTPNLVYNNLLTNYLAEVFRYYFPQLLGEEMDEV